MINIFYTQKQTPYVWASDLHKLLEIQAELHVWFPKMIEYGFVENSDFSAHKRQFLSLDGEKVELVDWAVQIEMAKNISLVQRSEKGKSIRSYLLTLDQKVQDGHLLNHTQITVLFEICKVVGFFTVQKFFENEHYVFKDKPKDWWDIRAKLLGYTSSDLKEIMEGLGKKYKSQKPALMHIDKYELIRMAIMDMFIALGKSVEYAKNVSNFAKTIAKEIKPEIYDDTNSPIDFKTPEQKQLILDLQGYKEQSKLLDKF